MTKPPSVLREIARRRLEDVKIELGDRSLRRVVAEFGCGARAT